MLSAEPLVGEGWCDKLHGAWSTGVARVKLVPCPGELAVLFGFILDNDVSCSIVLKKEKDTMDIDFLTQT